MTPMTHTNSHSVNEFFTQQESLQSPLNMSDKLIHVPLEITQTRERLFTQMSNRTDCAVALEAISAYIARCSVRDELTKPALILANIAVEGLVDRVGLSLSGLSFSTESYQLSRKAELNLALENVSSRVQVLYESLKSNILEMGQHILHMLAHFGKQVGDLKKRSLELEKELRTKEDKEAAFPAVKAESWCKYLCYGSSGFDQGLKIVLGDIDTLVSDHTHMATSAIEKYVDWFKEHAGEASDDEVFTSLHTQPKDFLLAGMSEFDRSIVLGTPKGDNLFYRSKELPGGYAFYVETHPEGQVGLEALKALESTRFKFEVYNPRSYETTKMKIAAIVALPVATWLHFVNPLLGMAASAAAGAYIGSQAKDGTGQQVHIGKDMLFQALTKEEMKHVLAEVKAGAGKLQSWSTAVLQKPWKSHDLDKAAEDILKAKDTTSNYKAYCNALLHLVSTIATGMESYAFEVYHACLLYVEKSLKQYR